MSEISELERRGLIEALDVKEKDVLEAKYNLLGFFNALYKIDKRLKEENKKEMI